jgi:hypothetical protein
MAHWPSNQNFLWWRWRACLPLFLCLPAWNDRSDTEDTSESPLTIVITPLPPSGTRLPQSLPLHSRVILGGSLLSSCPRGGIQCLILYFLFPKQLIMLLTSVQSRDGGREQWFNSELIPWRILPHTAHASPSTLLTVNSGVCHLVARHPNRLCQLEKSHLSVGRRVLLCLRPRQRAIWLSWKRFAKGETRGCPWGQPVSDGRPLLMKFTGKAGGWAVRWCRCNSDYCDTTSNQHFLQECWHWIWLGSLKPLLFFSPLLFPQLSYGELLSFAPLCEENRTGKIIAITPPPQCARARTHTHTYTHTHTHSCQVVKAAAIQFIGVHSTSRQFAMAQGKCIWWWFSTWVRKKEVLPVWIWILVLHGWAMSGCITQLSCWPLFLN